MCLKKSWRKHLQQQHLKKFAPQKSH
ncbi:unnamed protein product [Leptidea sinapis]|uniref:Uncharacterized protein n=1 Tax=Leptidea sinapis TaxID=189913 RepID=A0A5E4R7V6_9NEOP|nr:unnamed protein product [Leptidea sinapis]